MTQYFISDLHLNAGENKITELFTRFCQSLQSGDSLYILGDFFNAWIGDDACTDFDKQIMTTLKHLSDGGISIFMMYGNRDFLMKQQFFNACGAKHLTDETVIQLQQPTLLMHGDTLCGDDKNYLRYRAVVRNHLVQACFLTLPKSLRQRIANKLRRSSYEKFNRTKCLVDVTQAKVVDAMQRHHCQVLIHGHTHAPGVHHFDIDGKQATRYVLGAWHDSASIIKVVDGEITLFEFQ